MNKNSITLSSLLSTAQQLSKDNIKILLLLGLGAGALMRIAFYPAEQALVPVFNALSEADITDEEKLESAIKLINAHAVEILSSQLLMIAASALALVPWVRAIQIGKHNALSGGFLALLRRGLRCFLHLLAAVGLTLISVTIVLVLVDIIGMASAGLGIIGLFITLLLAFWFSFFFTSMAHLALLREATDQHETLFGAWVRLRLALRPTIACLAVIFFGITLLNLTIGNLLTALAPAAVQNTVGVVLGGTFMYLISALHIAAVTILPDPGAIIESD